MMVNMERSEKGMTENKRYNYQDFEEYCTITDTNKYPKDLNDFYNELVQEGYLEDYDGDKEVVLELAEEKYQEYLEDHCMSNKEIIDLMNGQDKQIQDLKTRNNRQYERLKELTDLMFKRDWETLGLIVDEWEKEEEQQRKYGG